MFESIFWQENLSMVFESKAYVGANRKREDVIRYFGETGSFDFLFLNKTQRFTIAKCLALFLEVFGIIGKLKI